MLLRPTYATRTDTRFPYTTHFRSARETGENAADGEGQQEIALDRYARRLRRETVRADRAPDAADFRGDEAFHDDKAEGHEEQNEPDPLRHGRHGKVVQEEPVRCRDVENSHRTARHRNPVDRKSTRLNSSH